MNRLFLGAVLGAVLAGAALSSQARAPLVTDSASVSDVTRLERRVAELERKSRLQITWNLLTTQRIDFAANRELSVSSAIGTSQFVGPREWGYVSASCITGTLVAGGMVAEWPMEVGQSELSGTTWRVSAFNPYTNDRAFLRGRGVCLSLR
jgi:hypothetical protein